MKQERFKILAVCGGNGSWLYSMKEYLTANIEPRAVFYTPNNLQWIIVLGKDNGSSTRFYCGRAGIYCGKPNTYPGMSITS